eukprot:TRINITY_DN3218_c0_g2_i1.p1 TRINITY_DN3218_c0_g2~~TRINITY_DN3218_c0_g2_i1.p1  ORF type:complete len:560 (+),score=243.18 TRINITY_DN3218_c0_g2_i1:46-1680(+)
MGEACDDVAVPPQDSVGQGINTSAAAARGHRQSHATSGSRRGEDAYETDEDEESGGSVVQRVTRGLSALKDDVSTLLEPTRHATPGKPIHTASVTFNILQSAMGVGILSLAATFEYNGIVGGVLLIVLCACMAMFSVRLLLAGLVLSGEQSFEGLGDFCFGTAGKAWVQSLLCSCSMVALTCFLVPLKAFIYDFLKEVMSESAFDSFKDNGGSENACLGVALLLVIFPVSLLRKIDKLWFTSFLGIFFIFFFTAVSVGYVFWLGDLEKHECNELKLNDDNETYIPTDSIHMFGTDPMKVMQAISIIACSYCCQFTIFPVYREVSLAEGKTAAVRKIERSAAYSMSIASVIYIAAAMSGYVTWREISSQPSSILACYKPSQPLITMCYFGMSCVQMFAFPLVTFSVRYSLATIFYKDEADCQNLSTVMHVLLTIAVVGPVATIAFITSKLTTVIAVGGAFTAPMLCYVIPGALYVKVKSMHDELHANTGDDDDTDLEGGIEDGLGQNLAQKEKYRASSSASGWAMLAFGCVIQVLCVIGAFSAVM